MKTLYLSRPWMAVIVMSGVTNKLFLVSPVRIVRSIFLVREFVQLYL